MITGAQIRMARGLLDWSVRDLSEASGVSQSTIKRMEESEGIPKVVTENLTKVQHALESAGASFIPENGGKAGVRPK